MSRSFGIVEDKLRETEFFLGRFCESPYLSSEAGHYFSAFVSAARSVTFTMQASLTGHAEFDEWYETKRTILKSDELAPLFIEIRNDVQKKGSTPVNKVPVEHLRDFLWQRFNGDVPKHTLILPDKQNSNSTILVDASEVSRRYFISLVEVVYECYDKFKTLVDGKWHFTQENFESQSLSIQDAVVELGFPKSWVDGVPRPNEGWKTLRRQQSGCRINDIFDRYLNKIIPSPDD